MALVRVTVPRMLADLVGGTRRLEIEGGSVHGVLQALIEQHPELAVHVFDETGAIRRHVSVFHNERTAELDAPVSAGDSVVVLQAVSGG